MALRAAPVAVAAANAGARAWQRAASLAARLPLAAFVSPLMGFGSSGSSRGGGFGSGRDPDWLAQVTPCLFSERMLMLWLAVAPALPLNSRSLFLSQTPPLLAQWLVSRGSKNANHITQIPESPTRSSSSGKEARAGNDEDEDEDESEVDDQARGKRTSSGRAKSSSGSSSSSSSLAAEVAALAALFASGALTAGEFTAAKAKLLAAQGPAAH